MSRFLKPFGCVGMSGLLLLILPAAARAATVTFNFDTCGNGVTTNASCGSSTTYTSGGFTITATAFPVGNANLYAKNTGGDELGLGLTNDTTGDNEITAGSFIQLDLINIPVVPLTIIMDSSTSPDEWDLYETNTAGATSGTDQMHGFNELAFTIDPADRYLDVTALSGNVLLHSLSFETSTPPVPEPNGLMLLGTGILGLAGVARRKLKV